MPALTFRSLSTQPISVVQTVLEWVLPATCILCENAVTRHGGCCPNCWKTLNFIEEPVCPRLGTPFSIDLGEQMWSAEAIADPPPFDRLRAPLIYDAAARKLVTGLKFHDRIHFAAPMARWMLRSGAPLLADGPIIIPIPLHRARLWSRRYNQSAELARHLARLSGCDAKYNPLMLHRKKHTTQQVGLTAQQRIKNVSGAFYVSKTHKPALDQAHVLLVDDVYTTGATVKSATRCLKRAGAARVDVLVFAKVESRPQ